MTFGLDDLKKIGQTFYNAGKLKEYRAILEAQKRIFDLQQENADLKEENRNFKKLNNFEKSLIFEKNAFYSIVNNNEKQGPFCPKCWGDENKRLRMQLVNGDGQFPSYWNCPKCNTNSDQ